MNDIQISAVGKALGAAELRFTASGKATAKVRVVIGHRKKVGDTWQDAGATFFDLQGWDKLAENMAESIHKGDRVLFAGRLTTEEWTGNDGTKRTSQRIQLDEIGLSVRFDPAKAQRAERTAPAQAKQDDPWARGAGSTDQPPF